jgi:hypothetical protein
MLSIREVPGPGHATVERTNYEWYAEFIEALCYDALTRWAYWRDAMNNIELAAT